MTRIITLGLLLAMPKNVNSVRKWDDLCTDFTLASIWARENDYSALYECFK